MNDKLVYTGGHKIGNCSHRWMDGRPFNFNFWAPGNPLEGAYENCVTLYTGKVWDVRCWYDTSDFVCESP
jgi:hypothetical protein